MSLRTMVKGWFTHKSEPAPASEPIVAPVETIPASAPPVVPAAATTAPSASAGIGFKVPTLPQMVRLCPRANSNLLAVFLTQAPISFTPLGLDQRRFNWLLATLMEESAGFSRLEESLSYSPARLQQVWPTRFPSFKAAAPYARSPAKLAEKVYGGRMGNVNPGDGWRYRGRSLQQITGRDMYARVGRAIGMDLVGDPDLAKDAFNQAAIVAGFYVVKGLHKAQSFGAFTEMVNGGRTNWAARKAHLRAVEALLPSS